MKLTLPSGATYGYDSNNQRVCTGSQMGRRDVLPASTSPKLHLQQLPFVGGCYDRGGAYWGAPANVFCAWDEDGTRLYLRADNRNAAKAELSRRYPMSRFYR